MDPSATRDDSPEGSPPGGGIGQRVAQALRSAGYAPLRRVRCRVNGGTAELSGVVPLYYLKQLAQSRTMPVEGVLQVVNLIEVA